MTWTATGRRLMGARGVAALIAGSLALAILPSQAHAGFRLGLQDPGLQSTANAAAADDAFAAMHTIDGSIVRISVFWAQVAPPGPTRPAGFDASNPADPHYRWNALDVAVRLAAQHHLRVILDILHAPAWAEGPGEPSNPASHSIGPGAWDPSPSALAQFARAAALRYSGHFRRPVARWLHAAASQILGNLERGESADLSRRAEPGRRVPLAAQCRLWGRQVGGPQQRGNSRRPCAGLLFPAVLGRHRLHSPPNCSACTGSAQPSARIERVPSAPSLTSLPITHTRLPRPLPSLPTTTTMC